MPTIPTYSPSTPQNPMEILRVDTRDTRKSMNPLTGICPTHYIFRGYRHASPHGDRLRLGIAERHSDVPQSTAHYSLLTANSSFTFSAKEKDSETGLSYFGSRYYSSDLSIWLSVDPQSDKYASLSPYVYCAGNPVKLVDPNGEEVSVFGNSENKNTIINSLNAHFDNITVGYDKENPSKLVIIKGTAQTEDEIAFAAALENTKIDVNLQLVDGQKTGYRTSTGDDLEIEGAGAFLGNCISYSSGIQTKENIAKVHTLQCLSVGEMERLYYEKDWGKLINHEITESFQGGLISLDKNVPGRDENGVINSDIYQKAHAAATPQPFTIGSSWLHH